MWEVIPNSCWIIFSINFSVWVYYHQEYFHIKNSVIFQQPLVFLGGISTTKMLLQEIGRSTGGRGRNSISITGSTQKGMSQPQWDLGWTFWTLEHLDILKILNIQTTLSEPQWDLSWTSWTSDHLDILIIWSFRASLNETLAEYFVQQNIWMSWTFKHI